MSLRFLLCGALLFCPTASRAAYPASELAVGPTLRISDLPSVWSRLREGLPQADLVPAREGSPDDLKELVQWNTSGTPPLKIGFVRALEEPLTLSVNPRDPVKLRPGGFVDSRSAAVYLAAAVDVRDSYRLRLHLAPRRYPPGTRFWVFGTEDYDVTAFGLELQEREGDLWTPSVAGPVAHLLVQVPVPDGAAGASYALTVDSVLEIFDLSSLGNTACPVEACLVDAACAHPVHYDDGVDQYLLYRNIESEKKAVARVDLIAGAGAWSCTGTLVADAVPGTKIPYLLTASHCLGASSTLTGLESYFDYIPATCNGATPPLSQLHRVNGGRVLERMPEVDLLFLRLQRLPPGRTFLDWAGVDPPDFSPPPANLLHHRLSHPCALPMKFTVAISAGLRSCADAGYPSYVFSYFDDIPMPGTTFPRGATWNGSSGSALLSDGGVIQGQLRGHCGPTSVADCPGLAQSKQVDGRFGGGLSRLRKYLEPTRVPRSASSLTIRRFDQAQFYLAWRKSPTSPPPAYVIEIKKDAEDFKEYQDRGKLDFAFFLPPGPGTYSFRVLARGGAGFSFPSNVVKITVR